MNERLDHFAREYLRGGTPIRVPLGGVRMLTNSTEVVLFREAPFQVELITLRRGCSVPAHTHPNIDTWEVVLSASDDAVAQVGRRKHGKPNRRGNFLVPIAQGVAHWARPGAADTVLLSIQFWHNGIEPTFITDDWIGAEWK